MEHYQKNLHSLHQLDIRFQLFVLEQVPKDRKHWIKHVLYWQEYQEGGVEQAVELAIEMNKNNDLGIPVPNYVEDVSNKVVKIIQSYTGIVNKMVWRK